MRKSRAVQAPVADRGGDGGLPASPVLRHWPRQAQVCLRPCARPGQGTHQGRYLGRINLANQAQLILFHIRLKCFKNVQSN